MGFIKTFEQSEISEQQQYITKNKWLVHFQNRSFTCSSSWTSVCVRWIQSFHFSCKCLTMGVWTDKSLTAGSTVTVCWCFFHTTTFRMSVYYLVVTCHPDSGTNYLTYQTFCSVPILQCSRRIIDILLSARMTDGLEKIWNKAVWPNEVLLCYLLDELTKTTKPINQDNQFPGWGLAVTSLMHSST